MLGCGVALVGRVADFSAYRLKFGAHVGFGQGVQCEPFAGPVELWQSPTARGKRRLEAVVTVDAFGLGPGRKCCNGSTGPLCLRAVPCPVVRREKTGRPR